MRRNGVIVAGAARRGGRLEVGVSCSLSCGEGAHLRVAAAAARGHAGVEGRPAPWLACGARGDVGCSCGRGGRAVGRGLARRVAKDEVSPRQRR